MLQSCARSILTIFKSPTSLDAVSRIRSNDFDMHPISPRSAHLSTIENWNVCWRSIEGIAGHLQRSTATSRDDLRPAASLRNVSRLPWQSSTLSISFLFPTYPEQTHTLVSKCYCVLGAHTFGSCCAPLGDCASDASPEGESSEPEVA
jgi:hypothetical protein